MFTVKIFIFTIITVILFLISRKSLTDIYSHGFYRFFVFEFIIILFLMNVDSWFSSLFSFSQIISWVLLIISLIFVIDGYRTLKAEGKQNEMRLETHLYEFEKTTQLVTKSIYQYIRHPMYSSLLFLTWGILFKSISAIGIILTIGTMIALEMAAKIEESENIEYFGDDYEIYMSKTKMFIPYIW